ncbi:MAG TPA: hypothetical protein VG621_00810 [Candidatus Paceibacterota bacterium]|nr:hypothetical protein [Candidatus Paceibacterota bacterium]
MPTHTKSFATRDGRAYFKHTGTYNEFLKKQVKFRGGPSAKKQKNLAARGDKTAAAITTNRVAKELGL